MQGIDNLPKSGGSSTLSGLSDVSFSSLTQGDLLIYDGAEWINHSFTQGHTILNKSGSAVTARDNLQFTDGLKVTDDSGNNKTKVGVDTTFTEAVTRTNIASGDTFATILGKIKKWFTDIPSLFVSKSGDTMSGNLVIDRQDGTTSSVGYSLLRIGNNKSSVTDGNSRGFIEIYGSGSNLARIRAISTATRIIDIPDASGTLALTSDIPDISTKVSKSGDTMTGTLSIYDANSDTPLRIMGINANASFIEFLGSGGSALGFLYARNNKRAGLYFSGAYHDFAYVPTVSLLKSNIYISTADSWVTEFLSATSLDDFDFIGFGWHRGDNASNWNQITSIVKTSVFKNSTHSLPCYVLDDPYSSADNTKCVMVANGPLNQYIDVYRGSAVWQYNRLAVFGIKF